MTDSQGLSGNTPADLEEVAKSWDESAKYCDEQGAPELAERDRRFASAMRLAATYQRLNFGPELD
jgi:hypothetical protein